MDITFLGTGEAYSEDRANVSILIEDKNTLLLECGFTTPQALWKTNKDKDFIDYIFISHFHGDHVAGLPLLCMKWRQEKRTKPLTIIGPKGLKNYFKQLYEMLYKGFYNLSTFPIDFIEVLMGQKLKLGCFQLNFATGQHLKEDTAVEVIAIKVVCDNKSLCYSGDTIYSTNVVNLAKDCELLVHEAYMPFSSTYHTMMAHCSPHDAARVAFQAGVKKLVLVHLHRDYIKKISEIINESTQEFKGEILVPKDGDVIKL